MPITSRTFFTRARGLQLFQRGNGLRSVRSPRHFPIELARFIRDQRRARPEQEQLDAQARLRGEPVEPTCDMTEIRQRKMTERRVLGLKQAKVSNELRYAELLGIKIIRRRHDQD